MPEKDKIEKIILDTIPLKKTEAIYIFGSYNTEFFDDDSDIDIRWFCTGVAEKERVLLECELEDKIGREVDLVIPNKNKMLLLNEILAGKWIGELSDEFCLWFDENITDIQDQAEDLLKLM